MTADPQRSSFKKVHWGILALWGVSLWLRLKLAPFSLFAEDEARIFAMTSDFYAGGPLPTHGAAVVYSGTTIPGSLLALCAGLPLWLTQGHPIGSAIAVACFNSWGVLMLYWCLSERFSGIPKTLLAAWIFFSPWTLQMNSAVNPHFLLPFSVAWLWSLLRLSEENHSTRIPSLVLGVSIPCMMQLHLSAVAIAFSTIFLWVFSQRFRPRWTWALSGMIIGVLPLIPWLVSLKEKAQVTGMGTNAALHLDLTRPFQFFSRLLTFPTADIVRFIEAGQGYRGLALFVKTYPILIIPALWALVGSVILLSIALRTLWKTFSKRNVPQSVPLVTPLWVFGVVTSVTGILFLFSIKGPSAHTFWILLPIAFIPPAMGLHSWSWNSLRKTLAWSYLVSAVIFSLGVSHYLNQKFQSQRLRVIDWNFEHRS